MATTSGSNKRLLVLVLVALGLWVAKDQFGGDGAATTKPASGKPARAEPRAASPSAPANRNNPPEDICTVPTTFLSRTTMLAKAKANPFVAPPPPPVKLPKPIKTPVQVVVQAPVAVPQEPAPLPPPKLPFTYMGQFVDPGRPTTVFLATGGTLINASPGDTVQGGFRLESIESKEIVFVHVQRNVTVRMPIEGDRL